MALNLAKATALMAFSLLATGVQAQDDEKRVPIPSIHGDPPKERDLIICPVEKQPEFIGGHKAMFKFLSDNIHYPNNIDNFYGTLYIGFVVETDGTLSDVSIKRGIKPMDEEAIHVVKLMSGKWTCGYQNGKPVRVAYTIPIKICLE
jgi:hypothetical protein